MAKINSAPITFYIYSHLECILSAKTFLAIYSHVPALALCYDDVCAHAPKAQGRRMRRALVDCAILLRVRNAVYRAQHKIH